MSVSELFPSAARTGFDQQVMVVGRFGIYLEDLAHFLVPDFRGHSRSSSPASVPFPSLFHRLALVEIRHQDPFQVGEPVRISSSGRSKSEGVEIRYIATLVDPVEPGGMFRSSPASGSKVFLASGRPCASATMENPWHSFPVWMERLIAS
jgi:hypothetical protein